MIAFYLSPIYIGLHILLLIWLVSYLRKVCPFFRHVLTTLFVILLYGLFFAMPGIGFYARGSAYERLFCRLGNYALGISLYELLVMIVYGVIRFIKLHRHLADVDHLKSVKVVRRSGLIALIVIALTCSYGIFNAHHLQTTSYKVTIKKQVARFNHLKICLVSDLHLGYNYGVKEVENLVNTINAGHPDLVVFAGDIFDNEYRALDRPDLMIKAFQNISSKYGCYGVYGNHDIDEKIFCGFTFQSKKKPVSDPRMDAFLKQAKIHLLRDQGTKIANSFCLFGRADYMRVGRGISKRKTPREITAKMDQNKPIIVIDHEPRELSSLAKAGVDLDLSGHTHNGQLFPGNIIVSMMYENVYGYLRKDNMHSIVTSGAGCFGPYMRIGAKSEICMINVNFQ